MRNYGLIKLKGKRWAIEQLEPHVAIKLKSVFPKLPKWKQLPIYFDDTPEICRDLEWFMARYPLEMSEEDNKRLYDQKFAHLTHMDDLERLLKPDYVSHAFNLRPGESLRKYQSQAVEVFLKNKRLLNGDAVGLGKAQPLDAKILTPTGFVYLRDIKVGDLVVGSDGKPTEVEGVFPQGEKDVYRIAFSDGTYTECCEDHLWSVQVNGRSNTKPGKTKVLSLKEISKTYLRRNSTGTRSQYRIPIVKPVTFFNSVPFHSYVMGVILGDGSITTGMVDISSGHDDIQEMSDLLQQVLVDGHYLRICDETTAEKYAKCPKITIKSNVAHNNLYKMVLKSCGLWGASSLTKFIPFEYKYSSIENRISLLQGLMDTDGYISKEGAIQYSTSSPKLSDDFKELVQSLGGISRVSTKIPSYRYLGNMKQGSLTHIHTLNLPDGLIPFRLKRKIARITPKKYHPVRKIVNIRQIRKKDCACIKVAAKDHLYLTNDYIVTHNTLIGIGAMTDPRTLPALVVVQTHLPFQWKEMIEKFVDVKVHLIQGTKPYNLPPADVYIIKYSCLAGWSDVYGMGIFKSVIFDEIQELRLSDSQKYQGAKILCSKVEYALGLSATPIYNFGNEIYNILNLLKEGCLGNYEDFAREWAGYDRVIKDPKALGTYLRENFLFLRRTREDVSLELPVVNKIVHTVDFDEKAVKNVEDLARQLAIKVTTGSFIERGQAARELDIMVRQMTGVSKAKYVADYVRILLENGEPVLLAGWHRDVYEIWNKELAQFKPVMYTGSETPKQKEDAKKAFMNGDTNLMIISLRSGVGLDGLQQRCSIVVFGELDWSPSIHHQVEGRLNRDGQQNQVTAIYLVSNSGSDPLMIDLLGLKASQATAIIDPLQATQAQYSDDSRIKLLAERYLKKDVQ